MTDTATRPAHILIRAIVLAVLALTLSAAFAQTWTAEELAIGFSMKTDAVYGCTHQDTARAASDANMDADCFTLEYHSESLARMVLDRMIGSFYDVTPVTPWQRVEDGILRMYVTDDGTMFGFGVVETGYHIVVAVMVFK